MSTINIPQDDYTEFVAEIEKEQAPTTLKKDIKSQERGRTMKELKATTRATILAIVMALGITLSPMISENASAKWLGGTNTWGYCSAKHGNSYTTAYSRLAYQNAGGWRCEVTSRPSKWIAPKFYTTNIDMNALCKWQYKDSRAWAKTDNWSNPYSWQCYN